MMANPDLDDNTDMPAEIDFSNVTRGKFYRPDTRISLPVYLEAEVQAHLAQRAQARGVDMAQLVNELLKKDIELIEAARWSNTTAQRSTINDQRSTINDQRSTPDAHC